MFCYKRILKRFIKRNISTVPDTLDCGYCLVNGTLKTQFRCKNSGGHGIFQLYPQGLFYYLSILAFAFQLS